MNIAIHQPNLFPRLKTLQKISIADTWVVLDDVQFEKREYQNRSLIIPTHLNSKFWLTLPVSLSDGQKTLIKNVKVLDFDVERNIIQKLKFAYKKSNELDKLVNDLKAILHSDLSLTDICIESTKAMLNPIGKIPQIIKASTLNITDQGKSERLAAICKALGADTYIADSGGSHYIDEKVFSSAKVNLLWQIWQYPNLCLKDNIVQADLRNSSALNLLARSYDDYINIVSVSAISKNRFLCEEKNESINL